MAENDKNSGSQAPPVPPEPKNEPKVKASDVLAAAKEQLLSLGNPEDKKFVAAVGALKASDVEVLSTAEKAGVGTVVVAQVGKFGVRKVIVV